MKKKLMAGVLAATVLVTAGGITTTRAFNLGDMLGSVLKVGGVGYVVDRFGPDIDGFLNKVLNQKNFGTSYATKVVPILSMGDGKFIGAAQVTGPSGQIDKVEGVLQLETKFNAFRIKGLVPVNSKNPLHADRVQGVGVSAIIDVHF